MSEQPGPTDAAIALRDWSVTITGRNGAATLLTQVNLEARTGRVLVLLGPSGAGKSTLLRSILGLVSGQGKVCLYGSHLDSLSPRERAERVAWLPQQGLLPEAVTVEQMVAAARYRFDELPESRMEAARSALNAAGISHLEQRMANTLSGGELQRVGIASMVAQEARAWLLDEPTNHLDPRRQRQLFGLLARQWSEGRDVVLVTHDFNTLHFLLDQQPDCVIDVAGLNQGRLEFVCNYHDTQLTSQLSALYEMDFSRAECGAGFAWLPA